MNMFFCIIIGAGRIKSGEALDFKIDVPAPTTLSEFVLNGEYKHATRFNRKCEILIP